VAQLYETAAAAAATTTTITTTTHKTTKTATIEPVIIRSSSNIAQTFEDHVDFVLTVCPQRVSIC